MAGPETQIFLDGRFVTLAQYEQATGRLAPSRARRPAAIATTPRSAPIAAVPDTSAVRSAERQRIADILDLPAAKLNPQGARNLALGSNATPAEASAALIRADENRKIAREASAESMRKVAGLPPKTPKPLTAGAISVLTITASNGLPGDREAAIAKLAEHGLNSQGR